MIRFKIPNAALGFFALMASVVYFYALDSKNAPTIPDEGVYHHITRITAQSGHWLPLKSELANTRNTKPPMLFWQGIASTEWGTDWSRFALRYPSVLYTLGTACMLFLLGRRFGDTRRGLIACLTFLAFYNTYRYGRPFLTSGPETFWYFLPFFVLLLGGSRAFGSRWLVPLLLGIGIGVGLLYKSFTLLAPIGLSLALWYWHQRQCSLREFLRQDVLKLALLLIVALASFGLWFICDPEPGAIFREFVLGENGGKFNAEPGQSYWSQLIWGGQSIGALFLAVFSNTGVQAPLLLGLYWVTIRNRKTLLPQEKLLWMLFITFFVIFSLPSVRSGRYLLPVMPAIALLIALRWEAISRGFFVATLLFNTLVIGVITWLSFHLQREAPETIVYAVWYWPLLVGILLLALGGLFITTITKEATLIVGLMTLAILAGFLRILDGPMGQFPEAVVQLLQTPEKRLGVPCDFTVKDETYRFDLPGSDVFAYNQNAGLSRADLAQRYPYFIVNATVPDGGCEACSIIGQRFVVRSMQPGDEIKERIRTGKLFGLLIAKQYLIDASRIERDSSKIPIKECR